MNHFRKKLLRRRRLPSLAWVGGILAVAVFPRPAHADAVLEAIRDALREQTGEAPAGMLIPIADGSKKAAQPKASPDDMDLTQLSLEQLMSQEIVPINVVGGHTHPAGQAMIGYRYMSMRQSGELDGTHEIGINRVLRQYVEAPLSMDMEMHMLEAMYAPTDDVTLMLMLPYRRMWMSKATLTPGGGHGGHHAPVVTGPSPQGGSGGPPQDHGTFQEQSEGLGDLTAMALYTFRGSVRKRGDRWLLNAGMSLPTGSIQETHDGVHRHEYAMQLGSGTFDLLPGITYLGDKGNWSFGGQVLGTVRLGTNQVGYRLGNQLNLNAWGSYRVNDWFAPTVRIEHQLLGRIQGADPAQDPLVDPTFDPRKYGGDRTDLLFGVTFYAPKGKLKGHRLTVEGGFPIFQSLNGPQLSTDWQLTIAWSYTH